MIRRDIKQEPGVLPKIDLRALVEKRRQQLGKIEKKGQKSFNNGHYSPLENRAT